MGIMEKNMETTSTIVGYIGFSVEGSGVYCLRFRRLKISANEAYLGINF